MGGHIHHNILFLKENANKHNVNMLKLSGGYLNVISFNLMIEIFFSFSYTLLLG